MEIKILSRVRAAHRLISTQASASQGRGRATCAPTRAAISPANSYRNITSMKPRRFTWGTTTSDPLATDAFRLVISYGSTVAVGLHSPCHSSFFRRRL